MKEFQSFITYTQTPVDAWRKLNVIETFRRRPGRLLSILCTFNLCPVSTGKRSLSSANSDKDDRVFYA